jgi:hypothetical protein
MPSGKEGVDWGWHGNHTATWKSGSYVGLEGPQMGKGFWDTKGSKGPGHIGCPTFGCHVGPNGEATANPDIPHSVEFGAPGDFPFFTEDGRGWYCFRNRLRPPDGPVNGLGVVWVTHTEIYEMLASLVWVKGENPHYGKGGIVELVGNFARDLRDKAVGKGKGTQIPGLGNIEAIDPNFHNLAPDSWASQSSHFHNLASQSSAVPSGAPPASSAPPAISPISASPLSAQAVPFISGDLPIAAFPGFGSSIAS